MIDPAAFAALFHGHPVPAELAALVEFQNRLDSEYSESLWLTVTEERGLKAGWSSDPAFLARLSPFGVATGSGSFWALWNPDNGTAPSDWPVVVFGDEGGEWVMASNVRELLQLAALDDEPMVMHDSAYFYIDDDEDEDEDGVSEELQAFRDWMMSSFGLAPAADHEAPVKAAQAAWQAAFNAWKQPFFDWSSDEAGDSGEDDESAQDEEVDEQDEVNEALSSTAFQALFAEERAHIPKLQPRAPASPDAAKRQLLLDFLADEAASLTRGEAGTFWPGHGPALIALVPEASQHLDTTEHLAFPYHLMRVGVVPAVTTEHDFGVLMNAYDNLKRHVSRGSPICSLATHEGLMLFGNGEFGRLPAEPAPTLERYQAWASFLKELQAFPDLEGVLARPEVFRQWAADPLLLARTIKVLCYTYLSDDLARVWVWALIFLALQAGERAAPVADQIRDEVRFVGDDRHVKTLEHFIAAANAAG